MWHKEGFVTFEVSKMKAPGTARGFLLRKLSDGRTNLF
jgi:hypothetical protein